jgi:predicted nucleotidyltransferase
MALLQNLSEPLSVDFTRIHLLADVHPAGFRPVTVEMLADIIQRIVNGLRPDKIILFGSYAYGNPGQDSDLDLLVILNTTVRPAERAVMVSRLLRPRPFPMDILVRTPEEIEDRLKASDTFIQEVMSKGVVLYERPG